MSVFVYIKNPYIIATAEGKRQAAKSLFLQHVGSLLQRSTERRKNVDKVGSRRTVDVQSLLFCAWGSFSTRAGTAYP